MEGATSEQSKSNPDFEVTKSSWMMNKIEVDDTRLHDVIREIDTSLPPQASVRELSVAVQKWLMRQLERLDPDPYRAEDMIRANKNVIAKGFVEAGTLTKLGEFFSEETPANVCQQNVLLLSALAAKRGMRVDVAGFRYKDPSLNKQYTHAVAITRDAVGQEYILDPAPIENKRLGDLTFLPKEAYLEKFDEPYLTAPTTVFLPS